MSVECDAAVENNISMQDEEEIAKKKQASRADCGGYIDTSEFAGGAMGFAVAQQSSIVFRGTEGSGKKAKRCNQSGEVPWPYEFSCKLQADFTKAYKPYVQLLK